LVRSPWHWQERDENQAPFGLKIMNREHQFAICVGNQDYPASLELWKVYRVLPDDKAAKHQLVRVIDESGEDYLYSESWFVPIKLPQSSRESDALGTL
jgi:hypothetical protein